MRRSWSSRRRDFTGRRGDPIDRVAAGVLRKPAIVAVACSSTNRGSKSIGANPDIAPAVPDLVRIVVTVMAGEVLGRERELGSVYAFLDRTVEGIAGFVLEGEPGIGKSALWLAAVRGAQERGFVVLSSRPAEAERGLAHAGLSDLLDGVFDDVVPVLTRPRRRALEVALLREETTDDPVDRRALAVAVLDVLQLLSERKPLVVAVDDVQWTLTYSPSRTTE